MINICVKLQITFAQKQFDKQTNIHIGKKIINKEEKKF